MADKSKIELIREFIEKCPLLEGGKVNVDYIKEKVGSYSVDETPNTTILKKYKDGGSLRQITFDFSIQAAFNVLENIKNSKFCDDFMDWIEQQDSKCILPDIEGAQSISCNRGTILQTTETTAVYVIPIKFDYEQEAL